MLLPYSLTKAGMQQSSDGPWHITGNGQVAGERQLQQGGRNLFAPVVEAEGVSDGGVIVTDVPELELPEGGDGNEKVPGEHGAHAQIAKGQSV